MKGLLLGSVIVFIVTYMGKHFLVTKDDIDLQIEDEMRIIK